MPNYFDQFDNATGNTAATNESNIQPHQNYFDQFDYNAGSNSFASGATTPTKQQQDNGAFFAGIDQFNRVFGRIAEGTIGAVSDIIGWESGKKKITDIQKTRELEAAQSQAQHPIAAGVGSTIGEIGLWTATGGPASLGGGMLRAGTKTALQQGVLGYLNTPVDADVKEKIATGYNRGLTAGIIGGSAKGSYLLAKQAGPLLSSAYGKLGGASGLYDKGKKIAMALGWLF